MINLQTVSPSPHQLRLQLRHCGIADRAALSKQLRQLEVKTAQGQAETHHWQKLGTAIERACSRRAERAAALPSISFDGSLPVHAHLEELASAIQQHSVVIVCGETGSGKTTQLPKICLALGRGVAGLIGHTQPRRIAARAVAQRIAEELNTPLGQAVGYQIRFQAQHSSSTYIKLMTDGILLAETQRDPALRQYDTVIIDEAHERSLNIDFLLGYLHQLQPKRPDLKLIITSATLDAARFSAHFANAPIIHVSGRTYPVEIRYASAETIAEAQDLSTKVVEACTSLIGACNGDILVFLPGEREIREVKEALQPNLPLGVSLVPLFSRLNAAQQSRIFHPQQTGQRIILATNIAETSLTVPGIQFVVDTGLARLKRYSPRAKIEQLLIEPISQAAAGQRAGRCGRVSAGICIRLYTQEDFDTRVPFTPPEILRSNLAGVVLRMADLKLGPIETFPFVDPPAARFVQDGYQLLQELGALDVARQLTPLGKQLACLPLDPRLGRLLLAGATEHCLSEMLIIAAALSTQDPREYPIEARERATQQHAVFADTASDFMVYLKLWAWFQELKHTSSTKRQQQNRCQKTFLSYRRFIEWQDLHAQFKQIAENLHLRLNTAPSSYKQIHCALISGLIAQIGFLTEQKNYLGARGSRFWISSGSVLNKKRPKWVVAAELVDTGKLYARCVASIEPDWVEAVVKPLCRSHYSDPHWVRSANEVLAYEKVTLLGLTLVARRRIHYGRICPSEARSLFIQEALANFDYDSDATFFKHNQSLVESIEALEHRSRRPVYLVDSADIAAFFDARLPEQIVGGSTFEGWRRDAERENPRLLFLTEAQLLQQQPEAFTERLFPITLQIGENTFPLSYRFEPGHPLDGITVTLPVSLLMHCEPAPFDWLVPGLIREKITALLKQLPKPLRRLCVPLPDMVTALLTALPMRLNSLAVAMAQQLEVLLGQPVPVEALSEETLPLHLRMHYRICDGEQELGMGRDLAQLQCTLAPLAQQSAQAALEAHTPLFEKGAFSDWTFGDLPETLTIRDGSATMTTYPALVATDSGVYLSTFPEAAMAAIAHRAGAHQLFWLTQKGFIKQCEKNITRQTIWKSLVLSWHALLPADRLKEHYTRVLIDQAFLADDPLPRDNAAFQAQQQLGRLRLPEVAQTLLHHLGEIDAWYGPLSRQLNKPEVLSASIVTLKRHLDRLIYPDFLIETPWEQLKELPRYLQALRLRFEKSSAVSARDEQNTARLESAWARYLALKTRTSATAPHAAALEQFRWILEEWHVSLFAQALRTPYRISEKRVQQAWEDLKG